MTEVIVAIFDREAAAETAVRDLDAARIPHAVIQEFANGPGPDDALRPLRGRGVPSGNRIVTVTADEQYSPTIIQILDQQAPSIISEAPTGIG